MPSCSTQLISSWPARCAYSSLHRPRCGTFSRVAWPRKDAATAPQPKRLALNKAVLIVVVSWVRCRRQLASFTRSLPGSYGGEMRPLLARRSKNLDLLRLLAAFAVLWSHQHAVSGTIEASIPYVGHVAALGLYTFFAISGYLNAKSLFRSKSAPVFILARSLRIFPALAVCALACVALGAAVTRLPFTDYISGGEFGPTGRNSPLSFFLRNTALFFGIDYFLPGVFETNIYPRAINGSLWTLSYEAKLYLYLAAAGVLCFFRKQYLAWGLFAAITGWACYGIVTAINPASLGHGTVFAAIFVSGVCLALLEEVVGQKPAFALFAIPVAILLASLNVEAAIWVGFAPLCLLLNKVTLPDWILPKIDISYGVYLYAFPIQQLVSMLGAGFLPSLAISTVLTTSLGLASAVAIEKPALKLKKQAWLRRFRPAESLA
jgi:peptidoglycan/LPS O-acetylase OafA/YrhL